MSRKTSAFMLPREVYPFPFSIPLWHTPHHQLGTVAVSAVYSLDNLWMCSESVQDILHVLCVCVHCGALTACGQKNSGGNGCIQDVALGSEGVEMTIREFSGVLRLL